LLNLPWKLYQAVNGIGSDNYLSQFIKKNPARIEEGTLELADWLHRLSENAQRYITHEIPYGVFSLRKINYKDDLMISEWIIGSVVILLTLYGVRQIREHRFFITAYFICTFAILLNWPELWFGPRFLFTLVPFIMLFSLAGLTEFTRQFIRNEKRRKFAHYASLAVVFIALSGFAYKGVERLNAFSKAFFIKGFKDYIEMAKWCRQHIKNPNAVIAARKPNLFHIYSDKYVVRYRLTPNKEELIEELEKSKVTHVVIEQLGYSSSSIYLNPAIQKYPYKFKKISESQNETQSGKTMLLAFRPRLGYSGDFDEDNKRKGFGKFVFENGNVYEGDWDNGVRNGTGKLLLTNGNVLEGSWENDKLVGTVKVLDPNNNFLYEVPATDLQ